MSTAAQPACASAPAATKKRCAEGAASATCKKAKAGQQPCPQQVQQLNMAQPFGWSYPPLPMLPFGPMMMPPFCPFPAMGMFGIMGGFPTMGMMGYSPLCQLPACTLPGNPAAAATAPCDGSAGQGMQQTIAGAICSPSSFSNHTGGLYSGLTVPAVASPGFSAGRTSSDASGGFQSLSCSNSLPAPPAGTSDVVPRAASPDGNGSVCMGNPSAATSEEDEEFASFIDTLFPPRAPSTETPAEPDGACMPRIDSLMNLLEADLELPSFC